jgi:hypothetical protein
MFTTTRILAVIASVLLLLSTGGNAHNVITYPGWRGDNLITNDTFPYGMQWSYPCEYLPFLVLLSTTSPRGGSREAERAKLPLLLQANTAYRELSSPLLSTTHLSPSPDISTTLEPLQSLTNIPSQAAVFPQRKTAPNGPSAAEPSQYNQVGSKATPQPSST